MNSQDIRIALYGPAGSGKDYVAKAIIEDFRNDLGIYVQRYAFADNLKKVTNILLGLNDQQSQDIAIYSEVFKNQYFIDLDSLETMWIVPKPPVEISKDGMQILYRDPEKYGIQGWFTIYTANSLFELFQKASRGNDHNVIPNMVQNWSFENVEYPEGYNIEIDKYRRLISYREYIVWIGTYCFQNMLGTNCLVNSMMNYINTESNSDIIGDVITGPGLPYASGVVITDLRFPHEYEECKKRGYTIVKIEAEKKEADVSNIAESHYSKFSPDFIFYNSRNEEEFKNEMKRLEEYIASK